MTSFMNAISGSATSLFEKVRPNVRRLIIRDALIWCICLFWMTAIAETSFGMPNFFALLGLNLLRLPLIMFVVYGTTAYLFPKFYLTGGPISFLIYFIPVLMIWIVLDRLVCGSSVSDWITQGTGLRWTFFNWPPLLRNTFILIALSCLMILLRFGKSIRLEPDKRVVRTDEKIRFKSGGQTMMFNAQDIIRLRKDENYVEVYTAEAKNLVRGSLREVSQQLPQTAFIRVHRSHVVSIKEIERVVGKWIILRNGTEIPLSRSHKQALTARLAQNN